MRTALAVVILAVAAACAAPAPPRAAWYDAYTDTIVYVSAEMAKVAADYGQPGVDWIVAHEEGHRTVAHLWREQGVDIQAMMPGATMPIRLEQAAQCEASAKGLVQPWLWGQAEIDAGYWTCPPEYVAMVTR